MLFGNIGSLDLHSDKVQDPCIVCGRVIVARGERSHILSVQSVFTMSLGLIVPRP